jgi:hypothetical protein
MALERWIAGQYSPSLAWSDAFTTASLNALANGNAILGTTTVANDIFGDMFADLSINLGSAVFAAPAYVGVYLYPANTYNGTFGDGRFSAAAAGPPPSCYWVGDISLVAASQTQKGTLSRIPLPPGPFRFVLYNQGGVTWAGSNLNSCQIRTYNLQLV